MNKKNYLLILFLCFFSPLFLSSMDKKQNDSENQENKIKELEESVRQAKEDFNKIYKITKILGVVTITYFFCREKKNNIRFFREIPSFPKLDTTCSYILPMVSILCTAGEEKQRNILSDLQAKLWNLESQIIRDKAILEENTIKNSNKNNEEIIIEHDKLKNNNNLLLKAYDEQSETLLKIKKEYENSLVTNNQLLKEIKNKESNLELLGEQLDAENQKTLDLNRNIAMLEEEIKTIKTKLAELEKRIDLTIFFKSLKEDSFFPEKHIQWMQNSLNIKAFNTLLVDSLTQPGSSFAASLAEAMEQK